ncbi:hypothetical protein VT03_06100 [Planctomyces sp. SH-PL14]|nr:hypothetical protein VT03_06100 [Planctomyces sp. SH-PL14]
MPGCRSCELYGVAGAVDHRIGGLWGPFCKSERADAGVSDISLPARLCYLKPNVRRQSGQGGLDPLPPEALP